MTPFLNSYIPISKTRIKSKNISTIFAIYDLYYLYLSVFYISDICMYYFYATNKNNVTGAQEMLYK